MKTYKCAKQVGLYVELTKYVKTMNYKKERALLFYPLILECVVNELSTKDTSATILTIKLIIWLISSKNTKTLLVLLLG